MRAGIDVTLLQIDMSDAIDDATERDLVRARRVVEYVSDRFPPARDTDAPDEGDRNAESASRFFVQSRNCCPKSRPT